MGNEQAKKGIIQDKEIEEVKKQIIKDCMTEIKQDSINEEHSLLDQEHLQKQLNFHIKRQRIIKNQIQVEKQQKKQIDQFEPLSQEDLQLKDEKSSEEKLLQISKAEETVQQYQNELKAQQFHHIQLPIKQTPCIAITNEQTQKQPDHHQQCVVKEQNLQNNYLIKKDGIAPIDIIIMNIQKILKFSNKLKGKTIQVDESLKKATQDGLYYQNQKLILSQPIIHKRAQARFRIINLKYCLGAGIALKEIIQKHQFNYKSYENQLSHGLFLLTTQGYSWSHSCKSEDDKFYNGFKKIKNGDVIDVCLNYNCLTFKYKEYSFDMQIPESVLKKYSICFVGYLHEKSDCLQLQQF